MRNLIHLTTILIALFFIEGTSNCQQDSIDANTIDLIILAPQGVDPAKDNVGYNDLVKNLTQGFSKELIVQLKEENINSLNVLDQDPKYDVGEKLAQYCIKHSLQTAIVLTLEFEQLGNDSRLLLKAQYITEEFILKKGKPSGVRPKTVLDKSYLINSSVSGTSEKTMTELVTDYIAFLQQNGKIN